MITVAAKLVATLHVGGGVRALVSEPHLWGNPHQPSPSNKASLSDSLEHPKLLKPSNLFESEQV